MFEYESSGKTISQAIENGLSELKLTKEEVDIKIKQNAGFLKKAKILLIVSDENAEKSPEISRLKKLDIIKEKIEFEEKKLNKNIEEKQDILDELTIEVIKENARKNPNNIDFALIAKNFLQGILKNANLKGEITTEEKEDDILIKINGKNLGQFIGKNGEGVASLQYLTNILLTNFSRKAKRVILDINNYKEKHQKVLEGLAHRLAKRVQETGKSAKLEPMNSFERRIVHNIISQYEELSTHSEGEEPFRYLIINLK